MPRCFIVFLDLRISLQQTSFELQTAHLPRPRHPAACTRLLSELEQALCSRSVPIQPTHACLTVYSINERTVALVKTRDRALHGRPTFRIVVGNDPVDGPNRGERDGMRGWVAENPKEGELQSDYRANQTKLQKQNSERCLGNIMRLAERSRSSQPRERSSLSSHGDYNSFETSTRRTDVGAVALLQEICSP
ncbi:hypothetical protein VFPFJ_04498 [Purpureocillium lilacinum]|uniref:Uncharacterized protein n=1 Tax=Purpureocillium lilacinum TaxID=33203 RepID=A0A179HLI5_PURLI|nr:hypothetical protein VFPFJ_04498 [Purpureocillium lilacinum]OAQ90339.1 hypothetical protein VFPFJ_04498 [Purpureocillium lilacinum]